MKPYETLFLLYSIKALLKNGNYDEAIELIENVIKTIEK